MKNKEEKRFLFKDTEATIRNNTLYLTRLNALDKYTYIIPMAKITRIEKDSEAGLFKVEFTQRHNLQRYSFTYWGHLGYANSQDSKSADDLYQTIIGQ